MKVRVQKRVALGVVAFFVLAFLLDGLSTFAGVSFHGWGIELNPVIQSWSQFAVFFLVNALVATAFYFLLRRPLRPTLQFFLLHAIVYNVVLRFFVAWNNWQLALQDQEVVAAAVEATPQEIKPFLYFSKVILPTVISLGTGVIAFILWKTSYKLEAKTREERA